ncbi:peptidoglycan DD-metalloendopeptidase family protein [Lysobacter koreensis]|uniref:Peptidoglycan DD-metalloendopeptidase family protein n=1 Tax=Lysobacter koreensis TaxID=266122 RepID=A0ABW2YSB8_9GAMM
MISFRKIVAAVLVVSLAACSSTVVRESGSARVAPRVSTPKYGATTVVQRGDTLFGIAFRNGVDVRELAAWNGIGAPYTIYPGQRLHLYPKSASRGSAPTGGRVAASGASRAPTRSAVPPSATRPAVSRPTIAPPTPRAALPIDSGIAWRWPADGQLLNRYVSGEPTKQGIDIAGSGGAPVRAAGDGVVVYSGSGLVGYGELIIIKHNDAWLSAYGHNRNRLVNEGQLVKGGQQIAEMGRSGAARDMLHFEVRYNGKPVDPLQYLPKR